MSIGGNNYGRATPNLEHSKHNRSEKAHRQDGCKYAQPHSEFHHCLPNLGRMGSLPTLYIESLMGNGRSCQAQFDAAMQKICAPHNKLLRRNIDAQDEHYWAFSVVNACCRLVSDPS